MNGISNIYKNDIYQLQIVTKHLDPPLAASLK